MSTIRVDNLQASDGLSPAFSLFGVSKASANVDGSATIAILESDNVASVTDNGVGIYQIDYTNVFATATYTRILWSKTDNASSIYMNFGASDAEPKTTANVEGKVVNDTGAGTTFVDTDEAAFLLTGDLA